MSSLTAQPVDTNPVGYFRIFARPPGGDQREITIFRGAPVAIESASTSDPFTESTASLSLPQVTIFDAPGQGDLDWLVRECDIDIVWQNYGAYDFDWRWEGFIVSYDFSISSSDTSFRVDLKGALFTLDNYLAKPFFPRRPIPYEVLIQKIFNQGEHPARLSPLKTTFPTDWSVKVPEFKDPSYLSYLKPAGVTTGQMWTGLTSRTTGAWEPCLSGFVQQLLTTMFDEGSSQWSIRNLGYRVPELYLRRPPEPDSPDILQVTLGGPGVDFQGSRDFTQSANVIYGQGQDTAGTTYTGMNVAPNGSNTYFKPFAWNPMVYPRKGNPGLNQSAQPKETHLSFQTGLDEVAASRVAQAQLQRFADPGVAGTLTLTSDPLRADGTPFPRMLVRAGTTFRIKGLLGIREGLLVHITQATVNFDTLNVALTFDSKYRDVLTVEEVQARTRDALSPLRALKVGMYANTVGDLLYPWSYQEGSGIVPNGGGLSAKDLFLKKMAASSTFPYENETRKYPPKTYPNYYIKIGPTDTKNSTNNWSGAPRNGNKRLAMPIRMGAQGSIRLSQIAAYDKNGNVLPVRFHVSVYETNGVGPDAMPQFPDDPEKAHIRFRKPFGDIPAKTIPVTYGVGNSNPFIENAWEEKLPDGTAYQNDSMITRGNSQIKVGWGNYFEPAGYSPGRASRGAPRTGLLEDNSDWAWDNTRFFDPQGKGIMLNEEAGSLFIEFYCDEQGDEPVYFMGRFFRAEPGTQ